MHTDTTTEKKVPLLSMRGIHKRFPGVHALKGVDFDLEAGEVCGILGENGAGKSTLMNVLGGVYPCEEGEIRINGEVVHIKDTKTAERYGISFIHQELSLFRNLDIATNIYVQNMPSSAGLLDRRRMSGDAKEILKRVGLEHCHPRQKVSELKIGEQQLVEIGRTLAHDTKILILDEPTSSLTKQEITILFDIVRRLKAEGVAIVFITHRMDEIYEICDSVMVMRDGEKILKAGINDISRTDVIRNMLGRDVEEQYAHAEHHKGELLLEVKDLSTADKLEGVSFEVHRGELVSLYGLLGSGRTEVLRCIFGLDPYSGGEFVFKGEKYHPQAPRDAINKKIAMVTEDRHKEGLVLIHSVGSNIVTASLDKIRGAFGIDSRKEREICRKHIADLNIKTPSAAQLAKNLSGGNQQKVVLAKWLEIGPDLLLLDEPTRGIDIGAKREIYTIIDRLLEQGMGVIMVSSELPEVLSLSDRVVVLKEGKMSADFRDSNEITNVNLLKAAMGG